MKIKSILTIVACVFFSITLVAQDESEYKPIDFSLQLKNMHLWRGYQVTNTAMAATNLSFTDKSGCFTAGVWGGAGFTGVFREFDYYLSYSKSGFTVALWDIYNFSKDANHNISEAFNYKAKETGHFIDLSVGYQFPESFPLSVGWATLIHGRDRNIANDGNRYSTYVSMDYPILRNKGGIDVSFGVAGAFALNPDKGTDANFYSNDAGIVNINIKASKKVQLGNYTLPVSVMSMWNPNNNEANIQVALDIF